MGSISKIETTNKGKYQKNIFLEILYVLVGLVLISYFGYQLYLFFDKPYDTETAVLSEYSLDVSFNGYFVRDEAVIKPSKQGVVAYKYDDGQKVTSTTKVAEFYKSEQDIVNVKQYERYQQMVKMLKENQTEGAIKGARLDLVVAQVEQNQIEYIAMIDEGNFTQIDPVLNNFSNYLNKLQVAKNEVVDYNKTIDSLEEKMSKLKVSKQSVIGSAKSSGSGYFSSYIDGLENTFSVSSLKNITYDKLTANLKKTVKTDPNNVGKLVKTNEWYYVASIDAKKAKSFWVGQTVPLKFLSNVNQKVDTKVYDIIYDDNDKKAVMIFKSDILNEDIINARFSKATAITNSYKGVAVSKDTVRFKDGQKGVYILANGMPVFKLIDTIYEDDDIVISRASSDTAYLSQYDQVIVKGKNLYVPAESIEETQSSSSSKSESDTDSKQSDPKSDSDSNDKDAAE